MYAYDIETYINAFTIVIKHVDNPQWVWRYQISPWQNDIVDIKKTFERLHLNKDTLVGYNNIAFDYPIVHWILQQTNPTAKEIYDVAQAVIDASNKNQFKHKYSVWDSDWYVNQLDLLKVHHFDNKARMTSLKDLEFVMRSEDLMDLPYSPHEELTLSQAAEVLTYNEHDVDKTIQFFHKSTDAIESRRVLSEKFNYNFMNCSDAKIGKQYFINRLSETMPGFDKKAQTKRPDGINLGECVFDYIRFERPEFQKVLDDIRNTHITNTKGGVSWKCDVDGFHFDLALGGIHGSIESASAYSTTEQIIVDLDVTSYYPSMAIANDLYPEHLGKEFCTIYQDVKNQRLQYAKGTPENAMFKLALNAVYGDSNNKYSCFFDPKYTMTITINGQLMLCMLAEQLMKHPQLQMIQINTDGLTVKLPRDDVPWLEGVKTWWEQLTGLELEQVIYKSMHIRDVNNYIAVGEDGKIKRKGAYEYKLAYHQNQSALVVPKAAEAALVHGVDIREFIHNHDEPLDFLIRAKVPRSTKLNLVDTYAEEMKENPGKRTQIQRISRVHIAKNGQYLEKVMPPLAKKPDEWRHLSMLKGWKVAVCNNLKLFDPGNIDKNWYVREAEKLVLPLKRY